MSNAFWVYGSSLQMGDGATPTENFTTVAEVKDITPPPFSRDSIEVTNQDSSGGWREFIAGWRDGGELTFEVNWLPTNATQDQNTGLVAQFLDDDNHNYRVILPDAIATISFAGHITNIEGDLPLEDAGTASVTIKVSGAVTIT